MESGDFIPESLEASHFLGKDEDKKKATVRGLNQNHCQCVY